MSPIDCEKKKNPPLVMSIGQSVDEKGIKKKRNQWVTSATAFRFLFATKIVEGAATTATQNHTQAHGDEGEIVFKTMTLTGRHIEIKKESVLPVHGNDGTDHDAHHAKGGEPTEKAEE